MPHRSLQALILLAAMLKPAAAKRLIMLARAMKLLDNDAAEMVIVTLSLEGK